MRVLFLSVGRWKQLICDITSHSTKVLSITILKGKYGLMEFNTLHGCHYTHSFSIIPFELFLYCVTKLSHFLRQEHTVFCWLKHNEMKVHSTTETLTESKLNHDRTFRFVWYTKWKFSISLTNINFLSSRTIFAESFFCLISVDGMLLRYIAAGKWPQSTSCLQFCRAMDVLLKCLFITSFNFIFVSVNFWLLYNVLIFLQLALSSKISQIV